MLTSPAYYYVKIESNGIGCRYVARTFSRERQEYTTKIENALRIGTLDNAKTFARTWSERLRCPFSVWNNDQRVFSVRG